MGEEEIIAAGILQALNRGQTLEQAMRSFLNAGYAKEVVERAARIAQQRMSGVPAGTGPSVAPTVTTKQAAPTTTARPSLPPSTPTFRPSQPTQPQFSPFAQRPQMPGQPAQQTQPYNPLEQRAIHARKAKARAALVTWLISISIVIITALVNGFLIWRFILNK